MYILAKKMILFPGLVLFTFNMAVSGDFDEKSLATKSLATNRVENSGPHASSTSTTTNPEPLSFTVRRITERPIIDGDMAGLTGKGGENFNGSSLIRVPDWVENPLGKYYLYFSHYRGEYIRMAYADQLEGPWTTYEGGVFPMEASPVFEYHNPVKHVASPDVHIDHKEQRLRLYYRAPVPLRDPEIKGTYAAVSKDGIHFDPLVEYIGWYNLRLFEHDGWHYGLAKREEDEGGIMHRSKFRFGNFGRRRGDAFFPGIRHMALWKQENTLYVFFSRIGDEPEHILVSHIKNLDDSWQDWGFAEPESLLKPEKDYEGVNEPVKPSKAGGEFDFVHELRNPAVFEDSDGRLYLLYTVAGEQGIAIAELLFDD